MLIPAGTIIQSAANVEPEGWFDCNGRTLLVAEYAYLFSAIGYAYSRNVYSFNIPDMRGGVGIGYGAGSGLTARSLGVSGGAETHTLTVGQMPAHSHTSNATGGDSGGLITITGNNTMNASVNGGNEPDLYANTVALTIDNTGSGLPHNNMQPYVVLRYLIKY